MKDIFSNGHKICVLPQRNQQPTLLKKRRAAVRDPAQPATITVEKSKLLEDQLPEISEPSPFDAADTPDLEPSEGSAGWDTPTELGANYLQDPEGIWKMRQWRKIVFSTATAAERLAALQLPLNPDDNQIFPPPDAASKDVQQTSWLRRMAKDPWSGDRSLLTGTQAQISAINAIGAMAPNFYPLTTMIAQSLRAAMVTDKPIRLPPILLLGPPGVGKTHVSGLIAKALDTSFVYVSMPTLTGVNPLGGTSLVWRNPKIGIVAEALIRGYTANPILLLDEIDKPFHHQTGSNPLDPLHGLLEAETARHFHDEFLELDVAADAVIWIASANTTVGIPPSILDRMLILAIAAPNPDQMIAVLAGIYTSMAAAYDGWFEPTLSPSVIDRLRMIHPRAVKRLLDLAFSCAASQERHALMVADIDTALAITGVAERTRRFGFLG